MAEPSPRIVTHREQPAGGAPPRVRVALVGGSGASPSDDLYRLLRRRLLVVTSITSGATAAGLLMDALQRLISSQPEDHIGLPEWLRVNLWLMINLAASAGSAMVLWRRPPASVRGLRVVELLVLAAFAAGMLWAGFNPKRWGSLQALAAEPPRLREAVWGWWANTHALFWFFLLTLYGAFIPNTWRRCASVAAILGACPLVLLAALGLWLVPVEPERVMGVFLFWAFWIVLAAVMAVFSTSRIETLQKRVDEVRKFGQYVLRDRLGAGGMGEVYRAEHVLLRRACALKLIRPEKAGDPDTLRRFEREVQTTATLTHPNTVQVFDYGHTEGGTFYYVMEYLPGLTLEELVRRHGPLPPAGRSTSCGRCAPPSARPTPAA